MFSKGGGDIQFPPEDVTILIEYLSKLMGKLNPLIVIYQWQRFRTNTSFNLWLQIRIVLSDAGFIIVYSNSKQERFKIIEDVYGQDYSSERINKLATNVANEIYKIIEHQVS